MKGAVKSINASKKKGGVKKPVKTASLIMGLGVKGDAHAGPGDRQVSLLAWERIKDQGLVPGDFAENITTEGLDLAGLKLGNSLKIGEAELRVSKIGKECHTRCEIFHKIGDCIMPKEGIFAEVLKGGEIKTGDVIMVSASESPACRQAGKQSPEGSCQ